MKGAVAAGHEITAQAGARVLAEGGNAFDACIAAAFASWVAESPLTGPGAGGFMLAHRARDRSSRLLDFFVATPGLGARRTEQRGAMEAVDIDFGGGDTTQRFLIGARLVRRPRSRRRDWPPRTRHTERCRGASCSMPAIELARRGVELTRAQALLHALLDSILRHTPEGRRIYSKDGARLVAGDRLVLDDLAGTLEVLATSGPDACLPR